MRRANSRSCPPPERAARPCRDLSRNAKVTWLLRPFRNSVCPARPAGAGTLAMDVAVTGWSALCGRNLGRDPRWVSGLTVAPSGVGATAPGNTIWARAGSGGRERAAARSRTGWKTRIGGRPDPKKLVARKPASTQEGPSEHAFIQLTLQPCSISVRNLGVLLPKCPPAAGFRLKIRGLRPVCHARAGDAGPIQEAHAAPRPALY